MQNLPMQNDIDNQLAGFWAIFADDQQTASEVVNMFSDYAPNLLEEIETAIGEFDSVTALSKLHKLKGTVAYIGFSEISELIRELEVSVKNQGLPSGADNYAQLKQKIIALNALLTAEVLAA